MPINSQLDTVILQDDLVVFGPPSTVDIGVDVGPQGQRGSQFFVGTGNPNNITIEEFENLYGQIPLFNDIFLRIDIGESYGTFYRYSSVPGADQWEPILELIEVIDLFFILNEDFILSPRSGGTGVNNGLYTITLSNSLETSGGFPINFNTSGSVNVTLPVSGNVAVRQDKLNVFAATTSAELASVITNETGTGALVFAESPEFTGTPTALTASADTNTTRLATTAYVIGQASSTNPTELGTVAVGTSLRYARADHVHPTNGLGLTSETLAQFASTTSDELALVISDKTGSGALVFAESPEFTGTPTALTASADTNTTRLATTAYVIGQASSTNPTELGTVAVGTSLRYARADHVHPTTGLALLTGATFTGEVLGISPTSSASFTTKEYVDNAIGAGNLPSQTGNEGKYLSTSGSVAFWSEIIIPPSNIIEKTSNHTLELSDAQKIIEVNSASAVNITIPADSSVDFPIGSNIDFVQTGAGQVTIDGEGGVTILSKESNTKTTDQYSGVTIYKKTANTWILIGDLTS